MAHIGDFAGPVLVFGGPYGNLEATRAVLDAADQAGIPPERTICTGDTVAYCADPGETVALLREAGIVVVMGNCEESLATGAIDCGCGYAEGSQCDVLSAQWFSGSHIAVENSRRTPSGGWAPCRARSRSVSPAVGYG